LTYWYTGCCSGSQVTGTSTSGFTAAFNNMNAQCGTTVTNQQSGTYVGTPNIPSISCPVTPTPVAPTPVAPVAPTPVAPTPVAPVAPTPVAPTPVAPVAPTPVAPTPVAPTPVAPTPVAPTPVAPTSWACGVNCAGLFGDCFGPTQNYCFE
jgi:hypothetical protein